MVVDGPELCAAGGVVHVFCVTADAAGYGAVVDRGGISDPGESNAVQNVRSQMAASPRSGVFNPLRRPKKKKDVGKPGGPDEASDGSNPNSKGNQTLQGGQGTAPGSSKKTKS